MTAEMRTIIIEAPSGERFETDVPCDTRPSKLAADFFEAQGWPTEQRGQRQRAVVELVNPRNADETKRLSGNGTICEEGVQNGDVLRIYSESVTDLSPALMQLLGRLMNDQAAQFDSRISALEKRLDETAVSLTRLTQILEQQAQSNHSQTEESVAALAAAFNTLAQSLQNQPITFRSMPPTTNRQTLFQVLRNHFNLGELRQLCFALEIPFADLPGDTLADKAREIVEYAQRHGQEAELATAVRQQRPNLQWETA